MQQRCDESCKKAHANLIGKKIFVGHREVAGTFSKVAKALRASGLDVDFVQRIPNTSAYETEERLPRVVRLSRNLNPALRRTTRHSPTYWVLAICSRFLWDIWALWAIFRYDYFLFAFGLSFWPKNIDLALIRLLGKHAVVHFASGSDSRPPWMDGSFQHLDCTQKKAARKVLKLSKKIKSKLWISERFANRIIGSPLSTSQFARKDFINSLFIGFPVHVNRIELDVEPAPQPPSQVETRPEFVIGLHAPSHPAFKGTAEISAVFGMLQSALPQVVFRTVQGITNQEVLKEVSAADFIVDQLYSDTPLAVFASEAAAAGKPAIVGGYGWAVMDKAMPEPIFSKLWGTLCLPEFLGDTVTRFVENEEFRKKSGAAAKSFVSEFLSPEAVAHRYTLVLAGELPAEWTFSPREVIYIFGAGQAQNVTLRQVLGITKHFGKAGLQISHNEILSEKVDEFIGTHVSE